MDLDRLLQHITHGEQGSVRDFSLALRGLVGRSMDPAENLADVPDKKAARDNLGLGALAERSTVTADLLDPADLGNVNARLGTFSTAADVQNSHIPPVLNSIRTNGYNTPGDGGGALYKRVASEPSHNSKVQSADGSWWVPVVPFGYAFDSVSDMQASRLLIPGARVRTLGYYSPGDGGGNDYEIVAAGTGIDDGGSFIDLSGSGLQARGLFTNGIQSYRQFGGTFLGDSSRHWLKGGFGIGNNETSAADRPLIRLHRNANHTGGSGLSSVLSAYTKVGPNVENFEWGVIGTVEVEATTGEHVGTTGTAQKQANGASVFGGYFEARDTITPKTGSTQPGGGSLVGCEIDLMVDGYDDANQRIGLHVIGKTNTRGEDSYGQAFALIAANPSGNPEQATDVKYGLRISSGQGSVYNGIYSEHTNYGIQTRGIGIHGNIRFDTTLDSGVISSMFFDGKNSSGETVNYGRIFVSIQNNTDGSEGANISFDIKNGVGEDVEALRISAASNLNPIFLRINGSLKQVTQGAPDSGGEGFRVLLVPN